MTKANRDNMTEQQVVLDLLKTNPKTPSQTLARLLAKKYPDKFTVERARHQIRYYRGTKGKAARKTASALHSDIMKDWDTAKQALASIPAPCPTDVDWNPLELPGTKILSLSDIHFPFHDPAALEVALEKGHKKGVDCILINGDLIDFYRISRFTKTMKGRSVEDELIGVYSLLRAIRAIFGPKIPIIWKLGNHEERWELHLASVSPALWETALSDLPTIIKNPALFMGEGAKYDLDLTFVKMRPMKIGHLWVLHGHEVGRGIFSPVNQARGVFLRTLDCTLVGHGHQTSNHSNKTIGDTVIACWSQGCLCDLHPRYNPVSLRWNHGFAIIERTDTKGNFELLNYKIIDNVAYVS